MQRVIPTHHIQGQSSKMHIWLCLIHPQANIRMHKVYWLTINNHFSYGKNFNEYISTVITMAIYEMHNKLYTVQCKSLRMKKFEIFDEWPAIHQNFLPYRSFSYCFCYQTFNQFIKGLLIIILYILHLRQNCLPLKFAYCTVKIFTCEWTGVICMQYQLYVLLECFSLMLAVVLIVIMQQKTVQHNHGGKLTAL